jgi:hypothetical protein
MDVSRTQRHTTSPTIEVLETSCPARPHEALSSAFHSRRPSDTRCTLRARVGDLKGVLDRACRFQHPAHSRERGVPSCVGTLTRSGHDLRGVVFDNVGTTFTGRGRRTRTQRCPRGHPREVPWEKGASTSPSRIDLRASLSGPSYSPSPCSAAGAGQSLKPPRQSRVPGCRYRRTLVWAGVRRLQHRDLHTTLRHSSSARLRLSIRRTPSRCTAP